MTNRWVLVRLGPGKADSATRATPPDAAKPPAIGTAIWFFERLTVMLSWTAVRSRALKVIVIVPAGTVMSTVTSRYPNWTIGWATSVYWPLVCGAAGRPPTGCVAA
jgi:hypothetical protein